MQARRILLLFAVVLLLTAAAASFVPVPEETAPDGGDSPPAQAEGDEDAPVEVRFEPGAAREVERVVIDSRVVVTVEAREPGEVEIEELGRLQAVGPLTPAVFDLFPTRTGRFDVVFMPVEGTERRLGTLVVGERGGPRDERRPKRRPA